MERLTVRLPQTLHSRLVELAEREGAEPGHGLTEDAVQQLVDFNRNAGGTFVR